ncbi:MAG: hypothetical protein ISS71_07130 [Phycisphaerae bacterium]|nr:hypothetical protein [Phycisphaerae bacterium]
MKNTRQIVVLAAVVSLLSFASAAKPIIEEGFLLDGVAGIVRKVDKVDVWNFIPEADIIAGEKTWAAESPLSLLPCSVLEQITGLAGDDNEIHVRLWGLFTEYNQNNYLYSIYFLPIQEDVELKPAKPDIQETQNDNTETTEESVEEEESIIPAEILEQIRTNKAPDLKKFQQVAVVTGDVNLIGRTGYLKQRDKVKFFQPDAFGQNVNLHQYLLLPCNAFEAAERQMQKTPGRQRYNISGLVTSYKGRNYILLRRAVRTYTNGNFTQ